MEIFKLRKFDKNDYEFVYDVKKNAYKKYVEEIWGEWNEQNQRTYFDKFIERYGKNAFVIVFEGSDIGFYNGELLESGNYEIGNICIIPKLQGRGIGTAVLKKILDDYKNYDIEIQYFKANPVGKLYKRLGFEENGETENHFKMIKKRKTN